MRSPDQKIDASMQAFAKKWLKSLDKPRPSTTLGYFFVGLFIIFWSSSLSILLGFNLKDVSGTLVFIGIGSLLTIIVILINRLLAKLGLDRPIRSALFFSAVIGPYVDQLSFQAWKLPVLSHVAGFIFAILAFVVSISLDRLLQRRPEQSKQSHPD